MVNIRICSVYSNTIALVTNTDCNDTKNQYLLLCRASIFAFNPSNHSSNQSKNSGVKYVRINVHPVGQGQSR